MDIIEKAKEYAEEKAIKGINALVEQAYLDGYNDGLKHYENEKLVSECIFNDGIPCGNS